MYARTKEKLYRTIVAKQKQKKKKIIKRRTFETWECSVKDSFEGVKRQRTNHRSPLAGDSVSDFWFENLEFRYKRSLGNWRPFLVFYLLFFSVEITKYIYKCIYTYMHVKMKSRISVLNTNYPFPPHSLDYCIACIFFSFPFLIITVKNCMVVNLNPFIFYFLLIDYYTL